MDIKGYQIFLVLMTGVLHNSSYRKTTMKLALSITLLVVLVQMVSYAGYIPATSFSVDIGMFCTRFLHRKDPESVMFLRSIKTTGQRITI